MIAAFFLMLSPISQAQEVNTKRGVAVKGYDVVAYFDGQPQKGDKAFEFSHEGVTYRFTSAANAKRFKADPQAYLPQYGGYCAYAIALNGKKVDIDPQTFEIRDGKLYLFYNAWGNNTLKKWLEDPEGLKAQADENWKM